MSDGTANEGRAADAEPWPPGFVRVRAKLGEKESRGTGALLTNEFVLTALHVIAADVGTPPDPSVPITVEVSAGSRPLRAEVLDGTAYDVAHDWSLLRIIDPVPPGAIPLVRHDNARGLDDRTWSSFGFPEMKPTGLGFKGRVTSRIPYANDTPALQLASEEAAAAWLAGLALGRRFQIQGVSGAPVLVDGAIAGILRSHLKDVAGGIVFATPIDVVPRHGERSREEVAAEENQKALANLDARFSSIMRKHIEGKLSGHELRIQAEHVAEALRELRQKAPVDGRLWDDMSTLEAQVETQIAAQRQREFVSITTTGSGPPVSFEPSEGRRPSQSARARLAASLGLAAALILGAGISYFWPRYDGPYVDVRETSEVPPPGLQCEGTLRTARLRFVTQPGYTTSLPYLRIAPVGAGVSEHSLWLTECSDQCNVRSIDGAEETDVECAMGAAISFRLTLCAAMSEGDFAEHLRVSQSNEQGSEIRDVPIQSSSGPEASPCPH